MCCDWLVEFHLTYLHNFCLFHFASEQIYLCPLKKGFKFQTIFIYLLYFYLLHFNTT